MSEPVQEIKEENKDLVDIAVTPAVLKQLKPKRVMSEKQMENAKRLVELNKSRRAEKAEQDRQRIAKEEEAKKLKLIEELKEKGIRVNMKPTRKYTLTKPHGNSKPKPKPDSPEESPESPVARVDRTVKAIDAIDKRLLGLKYGGRLQSFLMS